MLQVALQFAFTTLFGWHASRIVLATGSVWPAVLVHVVCNIMGFPAFADLALHPQAWLLKPALLLGIAAFAGMYSALQRPGLYGNVLVMGGNAYVNVCTTL